MRVRVLAYGILLFSAIDLVVLSVAPLVGWVPLEASTSTGTVVVMAIAFFLALMAMIGSISVLATDFDDATVAFRWNFDCGECGRAPEPTFAFCHHCGAPA